MNPEKIQRALAAMAAKAAELEVTGVAGIMASVEGATMINPHLLIVGRAERLPQRGPEDEGTNYLAVVCAKLMQMYLTGQDSGTARPPRTGELPYRGGVVEPSQVWFYAAFSGGTEEQDVLIARAGMSVLLAEV